MTRALGKKMLQPPTGELLQESLHFFEDRIILYASFVVSADGWSRKIRPLLQGANPV
jgi:hypothetical protein